MPAPTRSRYDVLIAGARCAGASTALLLARAGLRVLVVDPTPRGRDTLSTHALMRAGVLQLHRWGVLPAIQASGAPPIRTTVFDYGEERASVPIKPRDGIDALYAPRRTVLDPALVEAAEVAGAEFLHGHAVQEVVRDLHGRICGARIGGGRDAPLDVHADLLIGADGLRSRVASLVGAPVTERARHSTASIYGYWPTEARDHYLWRFRGGVSIGTIPTNGDVSCVFASIPAARFAHARRAGLGVLFLHSVAAVAPDEADALAQSGVFGRLRAFAGAAGYLRQPVGPGWALVGDAGFFRDPLTAHGITDALRDAELLARAVLEGTQPALTAWPEARDAVARPILRLTDRIASFEWSTDEVQALHLDLSRAMNAGLDVVRGWDVPDSGAPQVRQGEGAVAGVRV